MIEYKVKKVKIYKDYILELWFADGSHKTYDMAPKLAKYPYTKIKDYNIFQQVKLDPCVSICWPGEVDIAPEELYYNGKDVIE